MPTSASVLDLRRPPGSNPRLGQRRFEWSLSACASLLDLLRAQGVAVRILVLATHTATVPVRSAAQLAAFLTFLSEAEPAPHRPLEGHALQELAACERSYWIAAGGQVEAGEMRLLSGRALLVAEER
jgi:uncharacterized protein (DUF58 family)